MPWLVIVLWMLACSCVRGPQAARPVEAAGPERAVATPDPKAGELVVRATGNIQARKALSIRCPQITSQQRQLTLVTLAPNGSKVRQDDVIVEFDQTAILDEARDIKARITDMEHQLAERIAKAKSDSARRMSDIKEAEADLGKSEIKIRKGPVLSAIDRRKNEVSAESAKARVSSLNKSNGFHQLEEKAAIGVIEKKLERLKVSLERVNRNLSRLEIKAPQEGMIAVENVWRNGSMGQPQEGDQMYPGQPLIRIFDPTEMIIDVQVGEPDVAILSHAAKARVYLDAYPDAVFDATLESSSPVAAAGLDSPLRTFTARFRIQQQDPRLLPDLSASLEIAVDRKLVAQPGGGAK
ncbi:MAG: efflux RND transporter periplasmic adaptor subunit [Acidobacteria bacterium]|nr:efflux RND transporter periplasmic adaptor subunit [Acidobacteriota bacterium]